jgi:AcrR family transcriptional regulator
MSGVGERICEALLELACTQGYGSTSLEEILERAGASREEFERLFGSMEECAIAVFDRFFEPANREVRVVFEQAGEWPASLRAASYWVAGWMEEHPLETRFAAVELLWAGEVAQARREAAIQSFVDLIEAGRGQAEDPDSVPPFAGEKAMGQLAHIVTKSLQHGKLDPHGLVPELMYLAVLPYLGEEAARRELAMPAPRAPTARGARGGDPE